MYSVFASICTGWWAPAESARRGIRVASGRSLDSSHHPPRRSGDLGAKPKLQHSAVEALWSPISSASAGQSGLGWSRLSPRPASYPWLIARSRAGQSGAACADRKVGKSRAGDGRSEGCSSEKSRTQHGTNERQRARKAPTRSTEGGNRRPGKTRDWIHTAGRGHFLCFAFRCRCSMHRARRAMATVGLRG